MPACRMTVVLVGLSLIVLLAGCKSARDLEVRGDEYYMHGQYAQALEDYRQARRKDPEATELQEKILRTQIRLFMQMGDDAVAYARFADAQRAYEEVRRLDPGNPELNGRFARLAEAQADWHFQQGERHLAAGDPYAALPEFERALELKPGHARAQSAIDRARREQDDRRARAEETYAQGLAASKAGQFEEALTLLNRALQLDPRHPGAAFERDQARARLVEDLVERGDSAVDRGAWSEALGLYEQAHRHDASSGNLYSRIEHARREQSAEQWLSAGDKARTRGDWPEAYESYLQARLLTAEPDRVEDRFQEARTSYAQQIQTQAREAESQHRYEEALAGYRLVLDIQPDHPKAGAWFNDLMTRLDAAEAAYKAGARARRRGDLVSARNSFEQCTKTLPGYLDAAERLTTVAREVDLAETLYGRAREAEVKGRHERARILFEECLAITHPFRDVQERIERARAEELRGRTIYAPYEEACRAQASRDFERAQVLLLQCESERPGYSDVADRLAAVRRALEDAEAAYRRAEEAERRHELAEARDRFAESLAKCSGYRDAEDRLDRIESGLQLLREGHRCEDQRLIADARERYREVLERYPDHPDARERFRKLDQAFAAMDAEYALLLEAEGEEDYRRALALAVNIGKVGAGYRDLSDRIARLEIEADYADARAFEQDGRWEHAARSYERCVERDPKFRDAGKRLEACREKVTRRRDGDRWPGDRGSATAPADSRR